MAVRCQWSRQVVLALTLKLVIGGGGLNLWTFNNATGEPSGQTPFANARSIGFYGCVASVSMELRLPDDSKLYIEVSSSGPSINMI